MADILPRKEDKMSGKIRFLGLVTLLGLLGALLLFGAAGWAQKVQKAKPPQPPAPPADPAIAYVVNISKGAAIKKTKGQLMVMNADGSNQRVVVSETGVGYDYPDWSPEGTQLVFTREDYIGGRTSICIINVNGTGFRKVIEESRDGEMIEGPATWSPMPLADGLYKIAFADSVRRPDGTYEIDHDAYFITPDGTGLFQLPNTLGVGGGRFSGSHNGHRVS